MTIISVTRFGEISALLQHFKSLWAIFEHFYSVFGKNGTYFDNFIMLLGKFTLL